MTKVPRARATPLRRGLSEDIVVWEILVRLPPKTLLRCRAVCRAWRRATMTRDFLHAHHGCQPSLPIVFGSEYHGPRHKNILTFDHWADGAHLQPITRLDKSFCLKDSCDGLFILSKWCETGTCFSICNPVTHQHAPLPQLMGFDLLGMYPHHSTGEYRLLLRGSLVDQKGSFVYPLGSNDPPRYIGKLEVGLSGPYLHIPALVRDSLHWSPLHHESGTRQYQSGSKVVILFDTTSELFRQMRAPFLSYKAHIFDVDGTLGICSYNETMQIIDIWMLRNYESEVWECKYSVKVPAAEIRLQVGRSMNQNWYVSVHSVDGDVMLLVSHGGWMFYIDIDGKLVYNFHPDGQRVNACQYRLKETLVPHSFFTALEGCDVNVSPFV